MSALKCLKKKKRELAHIHQEETPAFYTLAFTIRLNRKKQNIQSKAINSGGNIVKNTSCQSNTPESTSSCQVDPTLRFKNSKLNISNSYISKDFETELNWSSYQSTKQEKLSQ